MADNAKRGSGGLTGVRELREMWVTEAQQVHSRSREQVAREQQRLNVTRSDLVDRQQEAARRMDPGQIIDIAASKQVALWLEVGENEMRDAEEVLEKAIAEESRAAEDLAKRMVDRSVLDRLLERRHKESARNLLRSEYRVLDDLAGIALFYKRKSA